MATKWKPAGRMTTSVLVYAMVEWIVMFVMFVIAFLSFMATKLASSFGLQLPCLLCSRLDHILGKRTGLLYKEPMCDFHKSEVSPLAYCNKHKKLSDVHGMCEACLLSFAADNKKSNSDTWRVLVGKLGIRSKWSVGDDTKASLKYFNDELMGYSNQDEDTEIEEPGRFDSTSNLVAENYCTCCGEIVRSSPIAEGLINIAPTVSGHEGIDNTFSRSILYGPQMLTGGEHNIGSSSRSYNGKQVFDSLPYVGYSELKVTSDTESEIPMSDDEDSSLAAQESVTYKEEVLSFAGQKVSNAMHASSSSVHPEGDFKEDRADSSPYSSVSSSALNEKQMEYPKDMPDNTSSGSEASLENTTLRECLRNVNILVNVPPRRSPEEVFGHGFEDFEWYTPRTVPLPDDSFDGLSERSHTSAKSEFYTPRAVPPTPPYKGIRTPPEHPSFLSEFYTPRAVPPSYKNVDAFSERSSSFSTSEFYTPRAVPLSPSLRGKGEALLGKSFEGSPGKLSSQLSSSSFKANSLQYLDEFATPRAFSQQDDPTRLSERLHSLPSSGVSTPRSASSSSRNLGIDNKTKYVADSTPVESSTSLLGLRKPEGMPNLRLGRPSPLSNMSANQPSPLVTGDLDLNDAYKLALGSKGSQRYEPHGGEVTVGESPRVNEDLKLLASQISSLRGISDITMSPRVSFDSENFRTTDCVSPTGVQSINRNESGMESLDGSVMSEIEGEGELERLKRQIDIDKNAMHALYKELEEERSASAIAANQAMAMITRLQEEKASMQMEALQYQRMMEEQAEYDQEALQIANELLDEREKDILDLEAELESLRKRFRHGSSVDSVEASKNNEDKEKLTDGNNSELCGTSYDELEGSMHVGNNNKSRRSLYSRLGEKFEGSGLPQSPRLKVGNHANQKSDQLEVNLEANGRKEQILKTLLLNVEDERLYLMKCLKFLRSKLGEVNSKLSNDLIHHSSSASRAVVGPENETHHPSRLGNHTLLSQNGDKNSSSLSPDDDLCTTSQFMDTSDISTIENGMLQLNERLEALEVEKEFVERILSSLRNGNEGLKLIQELAQHLREIRSTGYENAEKEDA